MTTRERAEYIVNHYFPLEHRNDSREYDGDVNEVEIVIKMSESEAYRRGMEDAAKILGTHMNVTSAFDNFECDCGHHLDECPNEDCEGSQAFKALNKIRAAARKEKK